MTSATDPGDAAIRVLLVAPEAAREGLADALTAGSEALVVEPAAGPAAALDRLDPAAVDAAAVDGVVFVTGSGEEGLRLLEAVRADHPAFPFVLVATEGSESLASEAIRRGVSDYVPWDGDEVPAEGLAERVVSSVTRRRGERALERFEKLIHHSSDVVFVVDETGTYQYLSPAVESVLGYEPSELVGTDGFDLVHPEDREATLDEFRRALEDPDYRPRVEFRARHRDGSWVWLEVRGQNLLDDPVVEGFVVNARDVSERKRYEREVAEQERRLHHIAEHLPATVIWMTDPAFAEVYYVSPGYEDLWGRPVEALYEDPSAFLEGVHPDDQSRVVEAMQDLLVPSEDGDRRDGELIEYRVVRPDGEVSWVQGLSVALPDEDGDVTRWVGIATDITARKERERELEGYETVHRTMPDGVFLVDEAGTIHHANDALASLLGAEPGTLDGTPFSDLVDDGIVDPSAVDRYTDLVKELRDPATDRDRGTLTVRASVPSHDDDRVFEAHVGLLPHDESFRGAAIVLRDVTELRRSVA